MSNSCSHSRFLGSCALLLVTTLILRCGEAARACPFCDTTSQTLSEEIAGATVSVIGRLVQPGDDSDAFAQTAPDLDSLDPDTGKASFAVTDILHGGKLLQGKEEVRAVYFGPEDKQKHFLLNGLTDDPVDWAIPLPLSERAVEYVMKLGSIPKKGPARLEFFLQHLEDEDPLLAQDAYDEFARAPYSDVIGIADSMDRPQLTRWIEDPQIGPTRRRLYLTMLGICGKPEDIVLLESLLRYDYQTMKPGMTTMLTAASLNGPAWGISLIDELVRADVRRKRQCLDALVAAYLKLQGPSGLELVERLFLKNPSAEYTHVYAVIMALRFHGEETDDIPRERLLKTLHLILDNPNLADQVIPDLARWEDWSVLERLVNMFNESEEGDWIRQPVISYVITATDQPGEVGERAKSALVELEEMDPLGVKRTRTYLSFGLPSRSAARTQSAASDPKPPTTESNDQETANPEAPLKQPVPEAPAKQLAQSPANKPPPSTTPTEAEPQRDVPAPNRAMIIGVPLIAGLVLLGIFALLLRGTEVRSDEGEAAPPSPLE